MFCLIRVCKIAIGAEAHSGAMFGEGSGQIWLNSVVCTGAERALANCVFNSSEMTSCTHAQDAGVTCSQGECIILAVNQNHFNSVQLVDPGVKTVCRSLTLHGYMKIPPRFNTCDSLGKGKGWG